MAFANPSYTDIIATTIESRSKKLADNVTKNNGLLTKLNMRGNVRTISGGTKILQEITQAANGNAGYYSGYDLLPTDAADVITAAEFAIKQAACPVVISGLEMLQNSGREQMIDLLEGRVSVAEASMMNLLATGVYSDGTGSGGKQITGLDAAVPVTPTTGTYGGINRATAAYAFWRSQILSGNVETSATIQGRMNTMWASCCRGSDRPDLIIADSVMWGYYMASLQLIQRFTDTTSANLGFPSVKFMDADVILDGGIGGAATTKTMYFLNTKYLHWRPHRDRNMVSLSPNKRYAINQDAEVQILAWAGNLTCSGAQFQGRFISS